MREIKFTLKQISPISLVYILVGLAYGVMMTEAGYSVLWTAASSLFIYAGSMQIVLVPLLVARAPLYTVAFVTLFVNARHLFYGLGLIERFSHVPILRRAYMALTVTDETYSVLCDTTEYPEGTDPIRGDFLILLSSHIIWIVAASAGSLIGELLPVDLSGMDFSATVFFVVVAVNQWIDAKTHIPAIIGIVSAVVYYFTLGADNFILPALATSTVALMLLRNRLERLEAAKR